MDNSADTSSYCESDKDSMIAELTRSNRVLKANISTLYRTARAELSRKEQQLASLRNELDNLIFRRLEPEQPEKKRQDEENMQPQTSGF